jgi:hypothetical protein
MTETATGSVPGVAYCGAPTREGGVCHQIVGVSGSGRCIHHDVARNSEAKRMRRIGAERARRRERLPDDVPPPPAPTTLQGVCDWLTWVAVVLASGQLKRPEAGTLIANLTALRGALTARDLEREVGELRAQVALLKKRRLA